MLVAGKTNSKREPKFYGIHVLPDLGGDEELLHGHVVHCREVLDSVLLATFPIVWQIKILDKMTQQIREQKLCSRMKG